MTTRPSPILFAAAAATLFANVAAASAQERVVSPGVIDLPVIEGSTVPDRCTVPPLNDTEGQIIAGCVEYPLRGSGSERNWEQLYLQALRQNGWQLWNGAGNVYWLTRDSDRAGCYHRLDMIAWVVATDAQTRRLEIGEMRFEDFDRGLFTFAYSPELQCDRAQ